jgi:hypothetical protein
MEIPVREVKQHLVLVIPNIKVEMVEQDEHIHLLELEEGVVLQPGMLQTEIMDNQDPELLLEELLQPEAEMAGLEIG